jgi:hypothetical protein
MFQPYMAGHLQGDNNLILETTYCMLNSIFLHVKHGSDTIKTCHLHDEYLS